MWTGTCEFKYVILLYIARYIALLLIKIYIYIWWWKGKGKHRMMLLYYVMRCVRWRRVLWHWSSSRTERVWKVKQLLIIIQDSHTFAPGTLYNRCQGICARQYIGIYLGNKYFDSDIVRRDFIFSIQQFIIPSCCLVICRGDNGKHRLCRYVFRCARMRLYSVVCALFNNMQLWIYKPVIIRLMLFFMCCIIFNVNMIC